MPRHALCCTTSIKGPSTTCSSSCSTQLGARDAFMMRVLCDSVTFSCSVATQLCFTTRYFMTLHFICARNKNKNHSHTGIRTRVSPVRAVCPNRLDYMGMRPFRRCMLWKTLIYLSKIFTHARHERVSPHDSVLRMRTKLLRATQRPRNAFPPQTTRR